jgi:hypothetical protein
MISSCDGHGDFSSVDQSDCRTSEWTCNCSTLNSQWFILRRVAIDEVRDKVHDKVRDKGLGDSLGHG